MNVTREIVKDLLPLYMGGEASPDTGRLVEAFLREDPELAALAEALKGETAAPLRSGTAAGAELRALNRTKALLSRRTWLLAFALFFTGLPLSFVADSSGVKFFLLRDAPVAGSASLAVAAALWIVYAVTVRRLRVSGL
jgi:anti-sigma factor RsiW